MTYHWTEHDIIVGRWVYRLTKHRDKAPPAFDAASAAHQTYQIGFAAGAGDIDAKTVLISVIDGMVSQPMSRKELALQLNEENRAPMPHKHLLAVIDHLRDAHVAT
jgi:hypothetical protein